MITTTPKRRRPARQLTGVKVRNLERGALAIILPNNGGTLVLVPNVGRKSFREPGFLGCILK